MRLPFEPAPFRKVMASTVGTIDGVGKRLVSILECGHLVVESSSRDSGQKRKRCKQCKENGHD